MTLELFVAFNIALIAALASPGPALLVAIQTTLSRGRAAGIANGCGPRLDGRHLDSDGTSRT